MSTFLQAWQASDFGMLVTDDPAGGAGHAAAADAVQAQMGTGLPGSAHPVGAHPVAHAAEAGFVVLPIAFAGAWGYTALRANRVRARIRRDQA